MNYPFTDSLFAPVTPYFTSGDLVELRSGGMPLTVLDFCPSCGDVDVAYADSDGDIEILTFPAEALKPFDGEDD